MPNLLVKFVLFIFVVLLNHAFANGQSADEYIKKANDEYRNGNYNQASELYDSAILAGDTKMVTLYNATCSHALAGNRDRAFELLEKIVVDGFMESDWLRKDEDLASLRDDEHWAKLMNTITENRRKLEESFPMEHKIIKSIDLPEPALEGKVSVESAISDRRSRRSYAAEPLTIAEIGQVLWAAYGISQPIESGPEFLRGGLRTAPSAGALYPLDIYLVAGEVEGLEPGIYLYDSRNHKLGLLKSGDIR
ncbi:MAG: TPR end-of-group domain-containing protein, partial [Bacteroidota bacterium]